MKASQDRDYLSHTLGYSEDKFLLRPTLQGITEKTWEKLNIDNDIK